MSHLDRAKGDTSGRCSQRRMTTIGSTASSAARSRRRLRALRVRQRRIFPPKRYRVSAAHFVDVRLRPRGDGHRAGSQACEAQGEAVRAAENQTTVKHICFTVAQLPIRLHGLEFFDALVEFLKSVVGIRALSKTYEKSNYAHHKPCNRKPFLVFRSLRLGHANPRKDNSGDGNEPRYTPYKRDD